jgi:hypothetical protein
MRWATSSHPLRLMVSMTAMSRGPSSCSGRRESSERRLGMMSLHFLTRRSASILQRRRHRRSAKGSKERVSGTGLLVLLVKQKNIEIWQILVSNKIHVNYPLHFRPDLPRGAPSSIYFCILRSDIRSFCADKKNQKVPGQASTSRRLILSPNNGASSAMPASAGTVCGRYHAHRFAGDVGSLQIPGGGGSSCIMIFS